MTTVAVWHGTDEALKALTAAVANNCVCDPTIPHVCSGHRMLSDQRVLDHLAFVAANASGYKQAEHDPVGEWL